MRETLAQRKTDFPRVEKAVTVKILRLFTCRSKALPTEVPVCCLQPTAEGKTSPTRTQQQNGSPSKCPRFMKVKNWENGGIYNDTLYHSASSVSRTRAGQGETCRCSFLQKEAYTARCRSGRSRASLHSAASSGRGQRQHLACRHVICKSSRLENNSAACCACSVCLSDYSYITERSPEPSLIHLVTIQPESAWLGWKHEPHLQNICMFSQHNLRLLVLAVHLFKMTHQRDPSIHPLGVGAKR